MSRLIYNDPADTLNKTNIKIYVSSTYEPNISAYYKKFDDVQPITSIGEYEEECISYVPISELINMLADDIEFKLVNSKQIPFIFDSIHIYLQSFTLPNGEYQTDSKNNLIFLDNCKKAMGKLYHSNTLEQKRIDIQIKKDPNYKPTIMEIIETDGGEVYRVN